MHTSRAKNCDSRVKQELVEAAYPETIPKYFQGSPAQQQQQLITALAAFCDRGTIASLALSDGHHALFDRVTPTMWQRFVTDRASSLPGSQTWVPKCGQPILLLVPGGPSITIIFAAPNRPRRCEKSTGSGGRCARRCVLTWRQRLLHR